jgi:hypothetical protein
METLLPTVLLLGLAVAFSSPISVISVIVLVGMPAGIRRAFAFLLGWVGAILLIAVIVALFPDTDFKHSNTLSSRAVSTIEILLGIALLVFAWVIHRRPPQAATGEFKDPTPEWLVRIVGRHWAAATVAGGLMLTYSITIIAASEILKAHIGPFERVSAMAVFAAASIVTVAAPIVCAIVAPNTVERRLYVWKRWLTVNSRSIGVAVLVVAGLAILAKATFDLIS